MYTINPLLFLLSTIISLSRRENTNIFNTYLRVFLKNNMITTYLLQKFRNREKEIGL